MKYRDPSKLWALIFILSAITESFVAGAAVLLAITFVTLCLIGTVVASMWIFWTVVERIIQWTT